MATVDRVLNDRPGVRARTIERVRDAIRQLGYVRDTHAANLARRREYRFCFALPDGPDQFVDTIRSALTDASRSPLADRAVIKTLDVPAEDPHAIVRAVGELDAARLDGVALMVPETPQVRDAVTRLRNDGVPVVALVSDLPAPARDHFIGVNGIAAGRTAGFLMGRFLAGKAGEVLVVSNSLQSRASIDRRLGFDSIINAEFRDLSTLPTLETHDDSTRTIEIVSRAIAANPGIMGVYSMVGGNEMLLDALHRGRRPRDLVVIVHELTSATRDGLIAGEVDAVISQNVGHLVRSALRVMRAISDGAPIYEQQERPRIEIVTRENIPD